MTRIIRKVSPGASPGLLVPPPQRVEKVSIRVICYGQEGIRELQVEKIDEAFKAISQAGVTWIDVVGLHDMQLLQQLGQLFGLHRLALEDVVNMGQRPKIELYSDHIFVVMRLPHLHQTLEVEQVSLLFGKGFVITLQEIPDGDPFEPVRERIRTKSPTISSSGADYLAYALIDTLVDSLYPVLEAYGEMIEGLENQLLNDPPSGMLRRVQSVKRDLLWMRRTAWPHREVVATLERLESDLIAPETKRHLRDCYEHAVQLMDVTDTFRELAAGLTDLYLSTTSNRMNEVMKVLTIMASIFIPVTFIAGIYGMNFESMPELGWRFGYPVAMGVMGAIIVGMSYFFRRKGWW